MVSFLHSKARAHRVLGAALALALALPALSAQAQGVDDTVETGKRIKRHRGPYLGVAPGANDHQPRVRKRRNAGRVATWVGFQWVGEGGRVFIQANEPPQYTLVPGDPDEIIIDLPDTRLRTRNDSRRLDTSWFPTAVASVKARQEGRDLTRVTIKLREVVGYDLRQEGNYLLLDFRPPVQPIATPRLGP